MGRRLFALGGLLFAVSPVFSAAANKVIVDNLHWGINETAHFQIYSDEKSQNLLPLVAHHLEKAYKKVVRDFDYEPKDKTPFFFYLTHNQFEQTNIVDIDEGTGGVAEAFKNRFLIPYTGSEKELKHVLTHEFTHILTFNILYGSGFWKFFRLVKTPVYPLWLMEGIAEYEGGENDVTTREMYLRDAVINKNFIPLTQLHSFNHLKPHQIVLAYKESESVLRFIAEEYGEEKVPELFFEILDKLDISSVLMKVIGLDPLTLDRKWQEYLQDKYEIESAQQKEPEFYGIKITTAPVSGNLYDFNTNAVWSPDGAKIAFLSDRNGETEVYLMDKDGGNLRRIVGLKDLGKIDVIHRNYTLYRGGNDLSFSPDGRYLVFAGEKNKRDYLFLYDLKRKKLEKIEIDLETLSQPSFSPDGKNIVFSGMKKGIYDLYLYNLAKKDITQLNGDSNDDCSPSFSPDGKWIVFSREVEKEYDLYLLNMETKEILPLTNMSGDEVMPSFSPDGRKILFVADKGGVYDLHLLDLENRLIEQLTRVKGGIFTPRFSPDGKEILFTVFWRGEMNIYRGEIEKFSQTREVTLKGKEEGIKPALRGEEKSPDKVVLFPAHPYRLRFSTDLFLPAFYFYTGGGFFYTYWQISEYLGNHQLNTSFTYSEPGAALEYELTYSYRRWRPQFAFGVAGSGFTEYGIRSYANGYISQINYPLDRFNSINTQVAFWRIRDPDLDLPVEKGVNPVTVSFARDTLEGKFLEPRFGSLINLSYTRAGRSLNGNFTFEKHFFYWQKFFPFLGLKSRFHSIFLRGLAESIKGRDTNEKVIERFFWPEYLIRGYGSLKEKNFALLSLEFRFPIFADINYHFWYLIPDLFFKYLGGVVFTDTGYLWKDLRDAKGLKWEDLKNSVGIGLRLNLFILQTYPLTLGLDWAKRTDSKESKWHFYIGPTFYLDVVFGVKRGLPQIKGADVRR